MQTVTLEAVNKKGTGILVNGSWLNTAKNMKGDFSGLKKGDTIEVDVTDDKWVNSFTKNGESAPAVVKKSYSASPAAPSNFGNKDPQIARAVAVKAIFESTLLNKDASSSEQYQEAKPFITNLAHYLEHGTWETI